MTGPALRQWRKENRFTQRYLAGVLGVTVPTLANWERNPNARQTHSAHIVLELLAKHPTLRAEMENVKKLDRQRPYKEKAC